MACILALAGAGVVGADRLFGSAGIAADLGRKPEISALSFLVEIDPRTVLEVASMVLLAALLIFTVAKRKRRFRLGRHRVSRRIAARCAPISGTVRHDSGKGSDDPCDARSPTALRHQLDPHFLFNSLASISGSLPDEANVARDMVGQLAEFFRLSLTRPANESGFTLAEELALLRAFLAVELMRWGDLLTIEIECPPELGKQHIPPLLLLPLVENALKYGRATSVDRVGVRLVVREETGALLIEVANTGRWVEDGEAREVPSLGVGLANVRARLAGYFPRRHELACRSSDGWVTVAMRIWAPAGLV